MAHTPGPWIVASGDGNETVVCQGDDPARPGEIAFILHRPSFRRVPISYEELAANATLAAAAPDLLEGCRAALGAFERNDAINWDDLRRVIAKAAPPAETDL